MIKSPEQIIQKYKKEEEIPLPAGFEWVSVDMKDPVELNKVFELLKLNFVEDNKALLRFQYSEGLLEWATCGTQYNQELMVAVRSTSNKKLLGFICGIPVVVKLNG